MSKLAVITGADGGMGKEITRAVAEAGYHVIMLCYTLFKGEERKNQMILETGNKEIEVRQVDLSSMASVINVADGLLGRGKHIDLLMNNAGTMSTHLMQTEDGLERTVAVNYVAPFLLTMRLLPLMGKEAVLSIWFRVLIHLGISRPIFFPTESQVAFGVFLFIAIPSWLCGCLRVNCRKG